MEGQESQECPGLQEGYENEILDSCPVPFDSLSDLRLEFIRFQNNDFDSICNGNALTALSLRGCCHQYIPPSVSKLVNLEHLDVRDNKIFSLPPELFELPMLCSLDLRQNPISCNHLITGRLEIRKQCNLKQWRNLIAMPCKDDPSMATLGFCKSNVYMELACMAQKIAGMRNPFELISELRVASWSCIGFDSLEPVEMREFIAKKLELSTPYTLCFDYPTYDMLARRIAKLMLDKIETKKVMIEELFHYIPWNVESVIFSGLRISNSIPNRLTKFKKLGFADLSFNNLSISSFPPAFFDRLEIVCLRGNDNLSRHVSVIEEICGNVQCPSARIVDSDVPELWNAFGKRQVNEIEKAIRILQQRKRGQYFFIFIFRCSGFHGMFLPKDIVKKILLTP